MNEKGTISVHTENIFPIIKKFLYSDQEVFLRELVSNAVDATQKRKQLAAMGTYEGNTDQLKIKVSLDEQRKTITISDQGIGMTNDEIKKYINQVAFSGATEFLEQYKDQSQQQQLIGFFGLGFYAAFMVANKVDIITKSYQKGEEAVYWTCDGTTHFELTKTVKKEVGTDVVLHLAEDAQEFLEKEKIQQLLDKYCKFLPVAIEFNGKVINNTQPIWTKTPSELQEQAYLDFYKELYPFAEDPLFWIHLNVDYPFNLTGILYFPKITNEVTQHQGKIQLYARQVFITNEVKDVVPEFLMLLHGVIDSPDIPLNVSRSSLQADGNVKKINTHIAKKVADKLEELFKQDRKVYEEKWDSIALFVKYGMLTEDKFYEKAKDFILLKSTAGQYFTLEEYQAQTKANQTDKNQNLVLLYATDPEKQDRYVQSCKKEGYDVLALDHPIDQHFVSFLEQKLDKVTLKGVDSDFMGRLIDKGELPESVLTTAEQERLQELYAQAVSDKRITWAVATMPEDELPVIITIPEFLKRMRYMTGSREVGQQPLPLHATINAHHPLARKLLRDEREEQQLKLARQVYNLALLSQDMLRGAALTDFMQSSIDTLLTV
jgi:molecular chaperone HtpG